MAQAETVAIPKRLPLVVQPENRDDSTEKDAKLLNAYVEKSVTTGELWVYKRPGLLQYGATKVGAGLGVYNWLGHIYSIFGATMYEDGVALVGVLDTTGGIYKFSQSLGYTLRLQFGNGVATYNYDPFIGIVKIDPLTTVTAGSFVVGLEYTILVVGTTDFTLIGAAANVIGTVFTATGAGAGTSVGNAASLGSFTSAQLATALTDETGTGANVFATSPTLVTPALGTPSSGVMTNVTGTASGLTAGNVSGIVAVANGGTGGTSSVYLATPFTSQTSILVTHNFGKYPVVNVLDSTGQIVIPFDVTHNSVNSFTVNFYLATTGNIIAVIGY